MRASIRGPIGSLLHVLLGVFLFHPEGGVALELLPSSSEVLLHSESNFTVVCSGWSSVKWRLPQASDGGHGVLVEDAGTSSTLRFINATWRNSGRYTCEEPSADQSRAVDVFISGQGPEQWFVPQSSPHVYKYADEGTVPCVVSNPKLNVSLYERPDKTKVDGVKYEPALGFTGPLNDAGHVCVARNGDEEKESQVFYVFTVFDSKKMEVELSVSSQVLKQGEDLTVNCTVRDVDMVFFSWNFPRRSEIEPLTDFLPNEIRSFVNISMATVSDSDRGYVHLRPSGNTNISSPVHYTVELKVLVDGHPAPNLTWSRLNHTISPATINSTHLKGHRYVSTLTLHQVQLDHTGTYKVTAVNEDDTKEVTFYLEVTAPPRIVSLVEVDKSAILCVSEGVPRPSVTWYTCPASIRCSNLSDGWMSQSGEQNTTTVTEGGVARVRSVLTLKTLSSVSAVRCEATNTAGGRVRDLRVLRASLLSQLIVLVAVLVLVILGVIFFIILIALWRNKPHYEPRWKLIESPSSEGHQWTYVDPEDLPLSSTWEIPRDHVVLGQVLGSGPFGRIVEATVSGLTDSDTRTKAVVKMMKYKRDGVQSLMSELKVLGYVGPHLNIVNLLGACTSQGPVYLITEFCPHGDLLGYLHRNKATFGQMDAPRRSNSDGGYMDMNKDERGRYVPLKELRDAVHEPAPPGVYQEVTTLLLSDSPTLTLQDLLSFSFQVAQAMDFLSSRKCVNRDLAARNVLVCNGKLVKVCDFGLARDLQKDQDYIIRGNVSEFISCCPCFMSSLGLVLSCTAFISFQSFLALKWMSPETIFQNIYSSESDVWSYGVLLWEIFSLGHSPYPELRTTRQFGSALKRGHRMDRPEHAPSDLYEVMKQCWDEDPLSRPSFSSLVSTVGAMLSADYRQRYLQLTEDFLKGKNPAVVQSSLSRQAAEETDGQRNNQKGDPASEAKVHQLGAEPDGPGPSHSTFIIPVSDVTVETIAALDAVSPQLSEPAAISESKEVTPPPDATEPPTSSSSPDEEEESCL
uniref:receptor protein-tyrosine kinase n=1 Tax=Cyprinodon variegatus TaxID=28743 RepID=A0A3Q2EA92_CYPVA